MPMTPMRFLSTSGRVPKKVDGGAEIFHERFGRGYGTRLPAALALLNLARICGKMTAQALR
jgi:hypothetical protein